MSGSAAEIAAAIGRHDQNYKLLSEAPCDVPVEKWVRLSVRLRGKTVDLSVDGKSVLISDSERLARRAH